MEPTTVPDVPRPITRRARRRSWNELPVRIWVVLTVLVWLIAAYVTATRVHQALKDRWLILHGLDIKAKIISANNATTPKRWPRNEPMPAVISLSLPDGRHYELSVRLEAKPDAFALVGAELPIKVDPDDPQRWTEQTEPRRWSAELAAPGMLVPLAAILTVVTLIRRQSVLRVWQSQPLVAGTVVQSRHTSLAPLSRMVRFTLQNSSDRRVWSTLLPAREGGPQPGQTIWLICPPAKPSRAIVARLYLEQAGPSGPGQGGPKGPA